MLSIQPNESNQPFRKRLRCIKQVGAVFLLCLLVVSCTNSRLVLRPLYNGVDNRIEEPLLEHADFDRSQRQAISDLIDHFHVWHRKTQLDNYALLMDEIIVHQKEGNSVTKNDIDRWSKTLFDYRENIGSCLPFYAAAPILVGLTDQQIIDIKQHREEAKERRRVAREAGLDDDDDDDFDVADTIPGRVKQIKRYLGFIGLHLNQSQLDDLAKTMGSTIRSETPFREVRDKLDVELYALLDQRLEPGWNAKLVEYINRRRQTLSNRRIKARNHNIGIWEAYALRTLQSFSVSQKEAVAKYLGGLSATVKGLAADTPSFQKRGPEEYSCLGIRLS